MLNQAHMWEFLDFKAGEKKKAVWNTSQPETTSHSTYTTPHPSCTYANRTMSPSRAATINSRNVHLQMSRAPMNVTEFRKPYTMSSRNNVNWNSWKELYKSLSMSTRSGAWPPPLTQRRRIVTARTGIRRHTKDSEVTLVLTNIWGSRTAQRGKGEDNESGMKRQNLVTQ